MRYFIPLIFVTLLSGLEAVAEDASKPVASYQVDVQPANIAPTVGILTHSSVQVDGQPRMTRGHPCTLWDQEDIDHYKEMLKTNKELQVLFANLKSDMDKVIAKPVDTSVPQKGPDGRRWRA